MIPIIVIALFVFVPVLWSVIFRVNVLFLFIGIVTGELIVRFLSDDAILAINAFYNNQYVPLAAQLTLLLLPVMATLLFMRKTLPAQKLALQFLPILACGLLLAVLAVPLFPSEFQQQVFDLPFGNMFNEAQDIVVGFAAVTVLLTGWQGYRVKGEKHGKHHK